MFNTVVFNWHRSTSEKGFHNFFHCFIKIDVGISSYEFSRLRYYRNAPLRYIYKFVSPLPQNFSCGHPSIYHLL